MSVINKGALFPAEIEKKIFSLTKGHSSLARLSDREGLAFTGKDIFTFNFDSDISIVGESAEKSAGDGTITPVSMQPVKVVYQMRTSNEFMYAADEIQLNILETFAAGFAKKLGAGLDKMAMHGVNPATGLASSLINTKSFDALVTANVVTYAAATADQNIDDAVALVEAGEYITNGIALSPAMKSAIAAMTDASGTRKYPDFAFGAAPDKLGNMTLDVNATVSAYNSADRAIVGDFDAFKWGIAKNLPLEVIEYGDPDGQGDLKRLNQVLLRSEAFIGWAIMDPEAFAIVKTA